MTRRDRDPQSLSASWSRILSAALLVAACRGESYRLLLSASTQGVLEPSPYQVAGDTLRLVAWELGQGFMTAEESSRPSSAQAPAEYSWSTTNSAVADMISPGVFVLRSAGTARINAWTKRAGAAVTLTVCAAGSVLTILPQDPTLDLGQTITFTHSVGIPGQAPCYTLSREIGRISGTEPQLLTWSTGGTYTAVARGSSRYEGAAGLGQRLLRDTILVTVK